MVGTLRFAHPTVERYSSERITSLHLLIRVDAPQALLLDPAVKAVADHAAPAIGAFLDLGDDANLQTGRNRAGWIGTIIERRQLVLGLHGDDRRAAAGQQGMIDPALGALGITHAAPVLELGG